MQFLGSRKKWWFIISGLIILPGLLALIFWGLRFGIDFQGGTIYEIKLKTDKTELQSVLAPLNLPDLTITSTNTGSFIIKTIPLSKEKMDEVKATLKTKYGQIEELRQETIGPTVSSDLRRKAILSVIFACLGIILYIAWAFRNIPKPYSSFRFGICAILALIHDLLVVVGSFAIVGHFLNYEVDAYFITALLTVLGFSVHDTIVVFDRIRENLKRFGRASFEETANASLNQTLIRSLNTSLTVLLTLMALFVLGGESIKPFVFALLVGITTGTYSSIFIATPLLVIWENRYNQGKERA